MEHKHIKAVLLALAMTAALTACGSKEEVVQKEETVDTAVEVETVSTDTIYTTSRVSGKVVSDNNATIMVAASAKCTAVYVEAGDEVQAGDVICTLDMESTLASYSAASINYASTVQSYNDQKTVLDQQVAMAKDNLENTKALFAIGAASQLEVDSAQVSYDSAVAGRNATLNQLQAGIESGKSSLEQLSTLLEDVDGNGNVIAPMSGTLVTMNAVEGSFISSAMPVAVINDTSSMKVSVSVSEVLAPKLVIGDEVSISVSSLGSSYSGVIRSVEKAANAMQLYTVTISLPDEADGLLAGMFADVTFHTDIAQNAVVIPTQAIMTSGETQYVYTVENGTACYVPVETGLTGDGVTEIISGLSVGDTLVTVGQSYLSDGDAVRVVSDGSNAALLEDSAQ